METQKAALAIYNLMQASRKANALLMSRTADIAKSRAMPSEGRRSNQNLLSKGGNTTKVSPDRRRRRHPSERSVSDHHRHLRQGKKILKHKIPKDATPTMQVFHTDKEEDQPQRVDNDDGIEVLDIRSAKNPSPEPQQHDQFE